MKRTYFLFIFALTLALSAAACGDTAVPALEKTEAPAVSITVTEREPEPSPTAESETSRIPALFTESAYSGTLLEYTGTALDGMDYPEAALFQGCLLIWNTTYSEMEEEAVLTLRLLALDTGEVEAETQITTMGFVQPQVCGSLIALCDSDSGLVQLLDENLNVTRKIQLQGDYSSWYMSSDGSALYRTPDYTSLSKTDLDTGTTSTLLSNAVDIYGGLVSNNGVNLTRLDSTTQTYQELWLDLDTGTVIEPPFDGSFSWVSCDNGLWLADLYRDSSVYYLGTDASPLVIDLEDGYLNLTEGGKRLIYTSNEGDFLALYDEEGSFVSSCTLPEGSWTGGTYLWSEVCNGYFFLLFPGEGEPELLFWALNADSTGENLETQSLTDEQQTAPGTAVDAALYERAEALGAACGVEILIADQCELVYDDFEAEQSFDEAQISAGLDVLETALSTYPEGFFDQLKYRRIETIQINLTGTLTPTNENWGDGSYCAFTQEDGDTYIMVLDLYQLEAGNIYHKFSHIIDSKLEWDSYCRGEEALFSEDSWAVLNPTGFVYQYIYDGFWDWSFQGDEWDYFIDSYSMVSPTEDRARVMEYAMNGSDWVIRDSAYLTAKLDYYCRCIRDGFDTTGWPEVTAWEQPLS